MPKEFYDNWVKIAGDESKVSSINSSYFVVLIFPQHYSLLNNRLKELGSFYGTGREISIGLLLFFV